MEINVSPRWSRLSCQLCTTLNGRLSVPRPTSPRHRCWDVKFQIGNPAVDFPRQESIEDSALQAAIEIFSSSFLFFFSFFFFLSFFPLSNSRVCIQSTLCGRPIKSYWEGTYWRHQRTRWTLHLFESKKQKTKTKQKPLQNEFFVSLSPTPPLPRLCFNYPTNYCVNRNSKLPDIVLFLFC